MTTATQIEKTNAVAASAEYSGSLSVLWSRIQTQWAAMSPGRRRWSAIAGLLLGGLAVGLFWYGMRTDWRTLYANLDPDDARQMSVILTQAQIPFDVNASGTGIRVPSAQLDKARLATAAKGGTRSGRMGFEIFDKPNWVGSEFDEQVNYQRALEGELEHTVASLSDVESARVHLVMAHDSLFRDLDRPAKASVVLKLRHRSLAEGEPDAIRNLVASAVDGLTPDRVVLVDAAGSVPLGPRTADAMRLSVEQALEQKLIATLEPVTGPGNVRASVTLDYEAASSEQTEETYDPDQTVTLSMQRSEQSSGPQQVAAGVPGTASNAPNSQSLPVYPAQTTSPQTAKTESGTYGASRTVRHTVEAPGRVRRLTAAVVVNHRMVPSTSRDKSPVWQMRSPDELRNITALAQAAVGFDSGRGDVLAVQDLPFDENQPFPQVSTWSRVLSQAESFPLLMKYAALLAGILVVVIFGLRPAVSRATAGVSAHKQSARELPPPADAKPVLTPPLPAQDPERARTQEIFEQVTQHLKREPTQSSRLLQSWIHSE